jgi:hypothetical protein
VQPLNLDKLRDAVRVGNIEWRKHVLVRIAERNITQAAVLDVLLSGERIHDYPEDKPFASALLLGYDGSRPLHVVASVDEAAKQAFIITVYEPSLEVFEADYKTKRKS